MATITLRVNRKSHTIDCAPDTLLVEALRETLQLTGTHVGCDPSQCGAPGLEENAFYDPKNFTFPGGTHFVEVEIDPDTGVVEVVDVAIAADVGVIVNPMIVDGQAHGGLAQGIGQALLEEAGYDADGQLVNASFLNYVMPRAADFPMFKVGNHVTPCTHNPLGVKGVGETGAVGVPRAVIVPVTFETCAMAMSLARSNERRSRSR